MDFKCVQHFVLMCCACSDRLFAFLANMAAIMAICRFSWSKNKKSYWDSQNILGRVLMHGMDSGELPEHI